jgi:diguanylate cyclase (GGDEF)-like protein
MGSSAVPRSAVRLFAVYAAVSAAVVLLLGLTLAASYRSEATRRGLAEGTRESQIVASTAIEPLLGQTDLRAGLTPSTRTALQQIATDANGVERLRIRDLDGHVVFSSDGSGLTQTPDGGALEAAQGNVEAELTRLNSDANDTGPVGDQVVEVYRPLLTAPDGQPAGILEMYLPYEPIRSDIAKGMNQLYLHLALGLIVLYVVLAGLSLVTTRRLRQQAQTNAYLAGHDQLTGLPNRSTFQRGVATLIEDWERTTAVAVVDIDRFKEVNDSLGHHNGDELLKSLGLRLSEGCRRGDVVARLGGDEFGIVLADVRGADDATAELRRLCELLSEPLDVAGLPLTPEASVGYALFPEDGGNADALLQHADVAMYLAKVGHAGVVRYDPAQDDYDSDRLALVAELRRALDNDELVLHYQPKASLADGSVRAVEALVRWNHPRHGLIFPDAFLPVAEQTGLIDGLTDWVLAAALRQSQEWRAAGLELGVAVNVSARNLCHDGFADRVQGALAASRTPAESIIVEVTETALLTDVERATGNLAQLAAAGVPVSVDDFGRGQTSLGYLATLPLHELKIDRSFVTDLLDDETHVAIVRSVIELSHNLGLSVVAEGVEDADTWERLRELSCDVAQGYVLTRPLPAAELSRWLSDHNAAVANLPR